MASRITLHGLAIDKQLHDFIVNEALPGTGVTAEAFFSGLGALMKDLAPVNAALMKKRDDLQAKIDTWHKAIVASPSTSLPIAPF